MEELEIGSPAAVEESSGLGSSAVDDSIATGGSIAGPVDELELGAALADEDSSTGRSGAVLVDEAGEVWSPVDESGPVELASGSGSGNGAVLLVLLSPPWPVLLALLPGPVLLLEPGPGLGSGSLGAIRRIVSNGWSHAASTRRA